jgi:hypothetical protein
MNWLKNPERLAAYRDPSSITRIGRLLLIGMLICTALSLRAPTHAHAAQLSSGPTLNLAVDQNNDSIPDELAAAVDVVAKADDKEAAIKDLVSRLPYSDETRALQEQAEALHKQLAETTDPAEAERISGEIEALTKQMEADPNYVIAIEALTTMFAPEPKVSTQAVDWGRLKRGDILLHRDYSVWAPYAMKYNHTGNYHGYGLVYESEEHGVLLQSLAENWQGGNKFTAFAYNNVYGQESSQVINALFRRELQYGENGRTRYNFIFPDKWTDARLYCSQLTWKIHKLTGVDLDSNAWSYQLFIASRFGWGAVLFVTNPAVAPDEIALSPFVTIYHSGWA